MNKPRRTMITALGVVGLGSAFAIAFAQTAPPAPAQDPVPPLAALSVAPSAQQEKKVSVSKTDVSGSELIKWLKDQGVSFAAETGGFDKGRYSVNIVNRPLSEAVEAIAEILGMSVNKHGGVYTLKPGFAFGTKSIAPDMKNFTFDTKELQKSMEKLRAMPELKEFKGLERMPELKELEKLRAMPELKELDPEARKALEEALGSVRGLKLEDLKPGVTPLRVKLGPENMSRLLDSLTPEQKKLNEEQGFLKYDDLTPQQRELLGGSDFSSITYESPKGKVTIKK
ncbi:MAG: hypothetical protein KIT11_03235 [Fimbriimonadaceae bacterium]|nr:hypothetical protein [Fimbriimonadaceae bacterium]QYK57089.1 MAG: hypothetical protein KF733_06290 [Fimbriimonadaceae bacterium]